MTAALTGMTSVPTIRIKIYTIFPGLFLRYYHALKEYLIEGRIPYICLPLQSGSPGILKLMNRQYDLGEIERVVREMKGHNPRMRIFTHFMVNFATETFDDFQRSLDMASLFDYCLFLPYGINKRTVASVLPEQGNRELLAIKLRAAEWAVEKGYVKGLVGN